MCHITENRRWKLMINRYLKRKLQLNKVEDFIYDIPMELEYYLIESRIGYRDELTGGKVYGIGVVKRVNDICLEEDFVLNYSCCINETSNLIEKLADNNVTPMGLRPILDDMLGA